MAQNKLLLWLQEEDRLKNELKIVKENIAISKASILKQLQENNIFKIEQDGLVLERKITKKFNKNNKDLIEYIEEKLKSRENIEDGLDKLLKVETIINAVEFKKFNLEQYEKNLIESESVSITIKDGTQT